MALREQMNATLQAARTTLDNYRKTLDLQLAELTTNLEELRTRMSETVGAEKALAPLIREHKVKEELYMLLLAKEQENALALAIAAPGAKANTIPAFTCFKKWMTADDILAGKAFPGQNVVIIGGGSVGCELADFLAPTLNARFPRNRKVTVLEMLPEIMMTEGGVVRSKLAMRMMEKGIRIESGAKVTSVTESTIAFEKDGTEYLIKDADTLIFANGYHIDSAVEEMLKATGVSYCLIGDGAKVGNIKDAISGAYEIARNL